VSAATCITGLVTRDLLGHLPPPLGVTGHEGSTVIVGLNGMRLLSRRAWMSRRWVMRFAMTGLGVGR